MKICYIADSASPHTKKWVKHFLKLGHEVNVISWSNSKIKGATINYLEGIENVSKKRIDKTLRNILKVKKVINKIEPDIIHGHQVDIGGFYCVMLEHGKSIISAWGSDILVAPNISKVNKFFIEFILNKAKHITSDSEYMSGKIKKLCNNKCEITTFPMGVEESIFVYKHKYNLNNNYINIISLRLHKENYNINIIINGFYEALKINSNMYLTIGGIGDQTAYLKELVNKLNIEDKVNFIGWYNAEEVGEILYKNDISISIPISDATSVSLLETMAVGVFPIVSDIPANHEWVKNNENGLVIDPTVKGVKNAIIWCLENKQSMKMCADNNINFIKETATWEENIKIVEVLYRNIINEN